MPIAIVSRDAALRDRLLEMCGGGLFETVSTHDATGDIKSAASGTVVLMHITERGRRIRAEIQNLRRKIHAVRIVMLTTARLTDSIRSEYAAQVDAVVTLGQPKDTLLSVLSVVRDGYRVIYPKDAETERQQQFSDADPKLSKREEMILRRLCVGGSNKEIANDLGIQEATVKVHLRACFRKIGAKNRTQAAMWAVERL